jgi:plastocyanin
MRTTFALLFALSTLAAGCGGSNSPSSPSNPNPGGTANTVTIRGVGYDGAGSASFAPGNLTVNRGTTVTWENSDSIAHSVVSSSGVFNGSLGPGGAFEHKFDNSGSFPYSCVIHAGMNGTITVRQ